MATADRKARTIAGMRVSENEALIESSFRRLLASVENEREKMRSQWRTIDHESDQMHHELESLKVETDERCLEMRDQITRQLREVDESNERMTVRLPDASEVLPINCSGTFFSLPKRLLTSIDGSLLNHMFSDEFISFVPRDAENNFFLDFNPICFGIIVQYLKQERADRVMPDVPPDQQMNMDILVEALHLNQFVRPNEIYRHHKTSLRILASNTIEATHEGWQVIGAHRPLTMAGTSFFEVTVVSNPTRKGGLGIGVCGHQPEGHEIHSINVKDSVIYSSGTGLLGGNIATSNVQKEIIFEEGSTIGLKHDVHNHTLTWYYNKLSIGTCQIKLESLEKMRTLFPVFALFVPGQKLQVDFNAGSSRSPPAVSGGAESRLDIMSS